MGKRVKSSKSWRRVKNKGILSGRPLETEEVPIKYLHVLDTLVCSKDSQKSRGVNLLGTRTKLRDVIDRTLRISNTSSPGVKSKT